MDNSLIRILDAQGSPVGVGFLVSQQQALTCAHVIRAANPQAPQGRVWFDFPRLKDQPRRMSQVAFWEPDRDIAGLELDNDLPPNAQPVNLVAVSDLWGHSFRAFGFPRGYEQGVWASGRILGRDANGWLQIEDIKTTGYPVQPGFSGGPLWAEDEQAVVGMVIAADRDPAVRAAFGLPVESLVNAWPALAERQILTCPYRGLFAFREQDAALFFGRETFVERLVEAAQAKKFVALIGPSGSGKSSVLYAGLIPRLRALDWVIVDFRLGSRPYEALAQALLPLLEPELSETDRLLELRKLSAALQRGELELSAILGRIRERSQAAHLLLAADQFEELYTLCPYTSVRQGFIDMLLELCEAPGWTLLISLRADFLGQALAYGPMADALQDADRKLGPMNAAELRLAIERPAEARKVHFEAGLVERILDDIASQPGALPLLEFALTLLWERQQNGHITHTAYKAIGKVDGALSHYADQVYNRLAPAEQEHARKIFTQLVAPGAGTEDTRRLASRDELSLQDWELVKRLADARLVVTDRTPAGEEAAEVVHEALIRTWGMLRAWMEIDRTFRSWQERLRASLRQWQSSQADQGVLLRGTPLAEAEGWLNTHREALGEAELAFIQASLRQRQQEQAAERRRWMTLFGTITTAVVLVATVVTLSATGQLNRWIYRPLPMEWVTVPAGEFQMGCDPEHNGGDECLSDELPLHTVYLDAYRIGKYEVTNQQYARCLRAGVCSPPGNSRFNNPDYQEHPVADVGWNDANIFCEWNSSRLPTEAEWEKAARGALDTRPYPWGERSPDCTLANSDDFSTPMMCVTDTSQVGSYPLGASPYGALDMAGNVMEWVQDWGQEDYYNVSPYANPPGPASGTYKVVHGGAWNNDPDHLRVARRYYLGLDWRGSFLGGDVGFRCAAPTEN